MLNSAAPKFLKAGYGLKQERGADRRILVERLRYWRLRSPNLQMAMSKEKVSLWVTAAITFGSGLLNLYSVIGPAEPANLHRLQRVFSLDFIHASRYAALLIGFALVAVSFNLLKRKRRAWMIAVGLCFLSFVFHLTKGLDYEEAIVSGVVVIALLLNRRVYRVKSRTPELHISFVQLAIVIGVALTYGIGGFWLLEPRHFGMNFHIDDAIRSTFTVMTFGNAGIVPQTLYAHWYLRSLHLATFALLGYVAWVLFQPTLYSLTRRPHDVELANRIREEHGRSSLDYFKTWPDKTIFISSSGRSFLAYGVALGFAVVLGDPVGPDDDLEETVLEFTELCSENGWRVAFHQTNPEFLPIYHNAGYKKLKIGDDALVDLQQFSLQGKERRRLRSKVNELDKLGMRTEWIEVPIPDSVLREAREVSDEWLKIPGRRERKFTLGWFDEDYVRRTPLLVVRDPSGKMLAFLNFIRSYGPSEGESDLMRRRKDTPNGIMDYLFIKSFLELKARGYARCNLGMAPMSGFQESEDSTLQERSIHTFFQRWERIFSFQGLRFYKAKFASTWEPRYVIYRNALDLPRMALALARVSAFRRDEKIEWSEEERDELEVA
jgi:phosphatidylglycerol lysyltransferase